MNTRSIKHILPIGLALLSTIGLQAQLTVTPADAQELIEQLQGQGVQISNPVLTVSSNPNVVQAGVFQLTEPDFDIDEGVLLTTGRIQNAVGPNTSESKSFVNLAPGDADLTFISGYATADACKLEFDIIPAGDTLRFDFSFASEEYDEYACTNYNDVFAFILTGVTDPLSVNGNYGLPNRKNLALIPGTSEAVTINNINGGNPNQPTSCPPVNQQFYHQNPLSPFSSLQYDGWTRGLVAFADSLVPCNTYHLELIIADASDRLWDSGVFIERITSNEVDVHIATEGGNDVMYEGCNNATISFCYETPVGQDRDIQFQLLGTAENGVDYELIQSADPDDTLSVTVLEGETCVEIDITTLLDGVGEDLEVVEVVVFNPNISCFDAIPILDSDYVYLYDSLEVYITGDTLLCLGEETVLGIDSGGTSFIWGASPAISFDPDANSFPVTISPTQTTQVMVTSTIAACVATDEVTVAVSDMSLEFDVTGETCQDACDGSIDMTVLNGVAPFSFQWLLNGQTIGNTEDLNDLCQGVYTIRVVDFAGCVIETSVAVGLGTGIQIIANLSEYNGGSNVSCNGACDGQLTVVVSGSSNFDIDYSSPGNPDPDINNLCAGPVTITVTDNVVGCVEQTTVILSEPDEKTIQVLDLQPVPCIGDEDGCATVTCTGGSGSVVSYIWTLGGQTVGSGATFCGPAGQYTVTATDNNGCTASEEINLTEPDTGLEIDIVSQTDVSCAGEADGAVCVTGTGGTGTYSYEWVSPALGTDPCISGLDGGVYVVEVTDAGGCTLSRTIVIEEPAPLQVLLLDENDIQCEGQSCGSALAVGQGGAAGYTYLWEPIGCPEVDGFPLTSPSAPFCEPCNYRVTVTDANGCSADTTINIEIISPTIELHFDITDIDCAGDSTGAIDMIVSGGLPDFTYQWQGGNCGLGPFTTEDLTNVCAGIWCVTVTDSNGCSRDTCVTIDEPQALNYAFDMTPTLCADNCTGAIDFTPVGGTPSTQGEPYTYQWQGPVGVGDPFDGEPVFSTDQDLTGLCKGWYQVTLTDSLGCSLVRTITVTAPDDMLIAVTDVSDYNGFQISCPDACDGYIVVDATGGTPGAQGYECTWVEQGIPFFTQGFAIDSLGDLCASVDTVCYEIIKEDDNGCIQNTFVCLNEPEEFTFNAESSAVTCSGDTDGQLMIDIEGGVPPYDITVTDSDAVVVFDVMGSLNGIETINGLAEGLYYMEVSDQNGCTGLDSILISTPNPLLVEMLIVPYGDMFGVSCEGDCNGIVYTTVDGGTPFEGGQYDHTWWDTACEVDSFSAEPFLISELCAGDYYVTVTDSLGCSLCPEDGIELVAPTDISEEDVTVTDVSCFGENDGAIGIELTGGTGTFTTIDWTPSPPAIDGQLDQSGLPPGTYTLYIEDSNDCDTLLFYTIDEPDSLYAVATSPFFGDFNVSCGGACDGSIELTIVGGEEPYDIAWAGPAPVGGSSDTSFDGVVCAGVYNWLIQDANGCSISGSIELFEAEPLMPDLVIVSPISCNGDCDGQLEVIEVTGGIPPYMYLWSTGTTGPITPDTLCPGTYDVTVTDSQGCSGTQSIELLEPNVLESSCNVNSVSCFGFNDGAIDCVTMGGTQPYMFEWTGPNGFTAITESISDLVPGEYCKLVTDLYGCSVEECYTITEPAIITVDVEEFEYSGGFGVSCSGACDGSYEVVVTGGSGMITIDPPMEEWVDLCAGTYPITVTDTSGCVFETEAIISEGMELSVDASSPTYPCGTNINCSGSNTGAIEGEVVGGDSTSYTYYWVDAVTLDTLEVNPLIATIDGLPAGTYILYVEDDNGCFGSTEITLTEPDEPFVVDYTISETAGGTNVSCFGEATAMAIPSPSGECIGVTYSWQVVNGEPVDPDSLIAGDYVVIAIDSAQCDYIVEITVTQPDSLIIDVDVQQPICYGDTSGVVCFNISGGSPEYELVWEGFGELDENGCASNIPPGEYTFTVTDANGCETEVELIPTDSLLVDLNSPTGPAGFEVSGFGEMDGTIISDVSGGSPFSDPPPYIYQWSGPVDLDASPEQDGLPAGQYCLTVTDSSGCRVTRCIELREPDILFLPNGISPNGDGFNDGLEIPGLEKYQSNTVKIFNRWGNEVFDKKDYSNGDQWTGEGKSGEQLPDGTYFVILVVQDFDSGQEELNGYLELRR